MKERPILFSGPMVRAILSGHKTQTRRVVKDRHIDAAPPVSFFQWLRENCPYGQPGDRLWVRETVSSVGCRLTYKADTDNVAHCLVNRWTPSIHMPRWASRILLEIVSVQVERLQDISDADLSAEGIQEWIDMGIDHDGYPRDAFRSLWESINGPASWSDNPWVWVIAFKRVTS